MNVLEEVQEERLNQNNKWGEQNHNPSIWLAILAEEFGEAAKEVCEYNAVDKNLGLLVYYRLNNMRKELIQTAAVAIQFVESLDRNELAE